MWHPSFLAILLLLTAPVIAQQTSNGRSVPRSQVVASAEREFATIDADRDNAVSRAELERFQTAVIAKNIAAANTAAFARLDEDKNGQLSAIEFAKVNPAPKAEVTAAFLADTDKDGKISLQEHRAATVEKFNKLDGNHDGLLTAEEVRAVISPQRK